MQQIKSNLIGWEETNNLALSLSCFYGRPESQTMSEAQLKNPISISVKRERFLTGKILGKPNQTSQEGRRKSSVETNYIDKKHIDNLTSKFEESQSGIN